MLEQKFNNDWKFWVEKNSFALVWNIPEEAKEIHLPHDAMMEKEAYAESLNGGNTGYHDGEIYNYVKILQVPEDYQNKTVVLKFEGVYMNAFVYVNGQLAGKNPFGYTTFHVTLNDFLVYGQKNEIRVQVRNSAMTNSRWYSGGGIYRDVYLLVSDLAFMVPESVQIKTESVDNEYAEIKLTTEIKNRYHTAKKLMLEHTVLNQQGDVVAYGKVPFILMEGETRKVGQRFAIEKPKLWSSEHPYLYSCESRLLSDEKLLDESSNCFGIRTLQLDAKRGLYINNHPVKLRGACIHHDSGVLGAATYEVAQIRQIRKLKEAGFNAVRMSHHPMAPAMLRACDMLGIYVMDETFDMWNRCKSDNDYGLYFQEWWEKDVTAMVRKNYNHPSVILYSVGNEIPEIGTPHGSKICHEICSKIKELDDSRYTLASINGVFAAGDLVGQIIADVTAELQGNETSGNVNDFLTLMDQHLDKIVVHPAITERLDYACAATDIAGYNYMTARYEMDGKNYPNRIIVGSETYPPEIARNWGLVTQLPHVIGDFTWTGWDYIGESGVGVPAYQWGEGGFGAGFPCQLAFVGDLDITGFRRPVSYYRECVFGLRKRPYIAVQPPAKYGCELIKTPWVLSDTISSWTFLGFQGKPVVVEVYSMGAEVELFLNEVLIGRKKSGIKAGFRTLFETVYEHGTLKAIAYDEMGIFMGEMELVTAGDKRQLIIRKEEVEGDEFLYLTVQVCDENEIVINDEIYELSAQITGGAILAGFGSGDPKPTHNYNKGITTTYHGRAQLILKRTAGKEKIKVQLTGCGNASLTL